MEEHDSVKLHCYTIHSLISSSQKNWKKFSHTKTFPNIILPQQHFLFKAY